MAISILDLITLFAYAALALDLVLEIGRVWTRKHSADISLPGMTVRTCAAAVILIKLFAVSDYVLVIGQTVLVALLITYLALIYRFGARV